MAVVFTGSYSGRFTSTGVATFIPIRSGVDRMQVTNETVSYAAGAGTGAKFEWQVGDALGRGTIYTKTAVTNALAIGQIAATAGFYYTDTSISVLGALNNGSTAITAVSTATPPRVTCGSTTGMSTGQIVRLYAVTGAGQLNGYDFTITVISGTTFDLTYGPTLAVAGTAGNFRVVQLPFFNPKEREITKILKTGGAVGGGGTLGAGLTRITYAAPHQYQIGQSVRVVIPSSVFGMEELDGLQATIVNIGQNDANSTTNTIDINIDSSAFTTFTFPVDGGPSFSPAQTLPIGMDTADAISQNQYEFSDATLNTSQLGITLMAGTGSPAGVAGDIITWIAWKSVNQ
jgi:hypothetical protein